MTGALLALGLTFTAVTASFAQDQPFPLQAPVLTIDMTQMFSESRLAERLRQQVEEKLSDLAAENRRIESELEAEELELTEKRKSLPPEEFRDLADAFDEKVRTLRAEQDEKGRAVQQLQEEERARLLQQITPVLADIARERGAIVLLDRRSVVLAVDAIDVTAIAIERIDASFPSPDDPQE